MDPIQELAKETGLDKKDIKKVYVKGGYDLYYPVIENGKPHLRKKHVPNTVIEVSKTSI